MTYVLHSAPSTAGLVVHWLLIELGVPFELRMLDIAAGEQKRPPFLALNPDGRVPVLKIDGRPHAEAAALLMLLAERHPGRDLAPLPGAPERAEFLQWMFYFANTMQPAFRAWYHPHEPAGASAADAVREAARLVLDAAWARLDALRRRPRPPAGRAGERGRPPPRHAGPLVAQPAGSGDRPAPPAPLPRPHARLAVAEGGPRPRGAERLDRRRLKRPPAAPPAGATPWPLVAPRPLCNCRGKARPRVGPGRRRDCT